MAANSSKPHQPESSSFWPVTLLVGALLIIGVGSYFFWKPVTKDDGQGPGKNVENVKKETVAETGSDTNDTDFDQLADVEEVQATLTGRLKKLSEKYANATGLKPDQVGQFAVPGFSAAPLDATHLETVFRSPEEATSKIIARRLVEMDEVAGTPATSDSNDDPSPKVDFTAFMKSVFDPIVGDSGDSRLRSKFKIFRIERDQDKIHTGVLVSFFALNSNQQSGEFNATLDITWAPQAGSSYPLIESIRITDYECATYSGSNPVGFEDYTASLFDHDPQLIEQFGQGADQWAAKIADHGVFGYNGICVGDVNSDGLDDLYLCQPFGLPNRLLIQQPDGTTKDSSAEWNIDLSDHTRSSLLIDLNNDTKQDLVVGAANGLLVYENNGSRFVLKSKYPDIQDPYSMCSADFDNDGDLDVYVCGYYDKHAEGRRFPFAFPMHDSNSGGPNTLLRNDGNFQFVDVTEQVGLNADNQKYSYAAGWQDFDNDGDQDLYVANDYGRNCFYEFENGKFRNRAAELEIEDQSFGMSVDWADINHDGRMDLYVSNMYSTAGNRVSFQDNYLSRRPELQNRMQYMARGNSLFLGAENGFDDIGGSANVFMGRWAWGSKFVDMNNDGWDDIVVPNGFLTRKIADDL